MPELIIVEGPDCSGKTTLIDNIRRKHDVVVHNGVYQSPDAAYTAYRKQLRDFLNMWKEVDLPENSRLILDRSILSQAVYGPIMRNEQFDALQYSLFQNILKEFNYRIVICLPPFGRIVIPWAKRVEKEYVDDFEKMCLVYAAYESLISELDIEGVLFYDYTQNEQEIFDALS